MVNYTDPVIAATYTETVFFNIYQVIKDVTHRCKVLVMTDKSDILLPSKIETTPMKTLVYSKKY